MILGLFTRPVAFILSGEMAAAYFIEHFPHSFFPILSEGDLAVSLCFTFLYLAFAGGGPWSLDAVMRRRLTFLSTVIRHGPQSQARRFAVDVRRETWPES